MGRGADILHLAAAPLFGVMALLTGLGDDPMAVLCAAHGTSWLSGMAPMYALMSAVHLPPWLRLVSVR